MARARNTVAACETGAVAAVPAPIRKVAPSGFITGPLSAAVAKALAHDPNTVPPSIQDSLSALGVVLSSTAPGSLHRSAVARLQMRRLRGLR